MRKAVVLFETKQGYVLPGKFPTPVLSVADDSPVIELPIGPPNVIARIVAFTAKDGQSFFYTPQDVEVDGRIIAKATRIPDNKTLKAQFALDDTLLLCGAYVDDFVWMNYPALGDLAEGVKVAKKGSVDESV